MQHSFVQSWFGRRVIGRRVIGRRVIGRRAIRFFSLVFLAAVAAFSLQLLLPGDATTLPAAQSGDAAVARELRTELGLDASSPVQFFRWVKAAVHGSLGVSSTTKEPVLDIVARAGRVTIELAIAAQIVAIIVGFTFALLSVRRIGGRLDTIIRALSFGILATPSFAVAALLLSVFAIHFRLVPAVGFVPLTADIKKNLQSMILPSLTLGVPIGAVICRVLRTDLVANLSSDHATLCRALGYSQRRIVFRHALRTSCINVSSFIGLEFARLLGGTLIIEQLFALPGLGRVAIESVSRRDQPVVQALVLTAAIGFLFTAEAVEVLQSTLDPRLRRARPQAL
jgi:peptide/nickel transport system permease protein